MSAAEERINELLRTARRQVDAGDREQALKTLRKALDLNPGNDKVREEIQTIEREISAMHAFRRSRTVRGHSPDDSSVSSGESFVDACLRRSQEAADSGDEIRALQELERARRQDPENPEIQKRIKLVKRAIKANNLADLGLTRLRAGDPAGAVEQARAIFDFWPSSPALARLVGEIESAGEQGARPAEPLAAEEFEEEPAQIEIEEHPPLPEAEPVHEGAVLLASEDQAVAAIRDRIAASSYEEALAIARDARERFPESQLISDLTTKLEKATAPAVSVSQAPIPAVKEAPRKPSALEPAAEARPREAVPAAGRGKPPVLVIAAASLLIVAVVVLVVFVFRKKPQPVVPEIVPYTASLVVEGPQSAAVNVDGVPVSPGAGGVYTLTGTDFGTRQIEVRADGYELLSMQLDLGQGQVLSDTLVMQPLGTGTAEISFDLLMPEGEEQPEDGEVTFLVDGQPASQIPFPTRTGQHVFQAVLQGYNSLPETVLVDVPGPFTQQLALLSPETSQISLTLAGEIPGTAVFYVDGVQVGSGRRVTHIADRGRHSLLVTMEGRLDWTRSIDLGPDGFSQVVTLEEEVNTGRLLIGPEPWAQVTINGVDYGQTPLPPIELEPGTYTVRLTNPDYEDQVQTVTITLGEDTSIRYTAQEIPDEPEIIEEQPVIPPFPTSQVAPQIPSLAAQRGDVHGFVTLEVRVGTDGSVQGVTVTNDPLGLGCGQAAADAVRQWRFNPATQGGVPVEVTTAVQVRFDIE